MQVVNSESRLCELLVVDPTIITVLNRFGINLGVGDKTIQKVCEENEIDPTFLISILNTFINEDYFPLEVLGSFSAVEIINYLNKTNAYYLHFQIPNIERHFKYLMDKSNENNSSLIFIQQFFFEVRNELQSRIAEDKSMWFPNIINLENEIGRITITENIEYSIIEDSIEAKINDLLNMFIMHLSGEYDNNLAHAVLIALFNLKKDLNQNNRIRERILRPLHTALQSIKKQKYGL